MLVRSVSLSALCPRHDYQGPNLTTAYGVRNWADVKLKGFCRLRPLVEQLFCTASSAPFESNVHPHMVLLKCNKHLARTLPVLLTTTIATLQLVLRLCVCSALKPICFYAVWSWSWSDKFGFLLTTASNDSY